MKKERWEKTVENAVSKDNKNVLFALFDDRSKKS